MSSSLEIDLSKVPAATPLPGYVSNLIHPDRTLESGVTAVSAVMIILTSLFVIIRLYANLRVARKLGWDDGKSSHHF